jgi:ABC-type multidrug transport system fused ATPase/permease subunit
MLGMRVTWVNSNFRSALMLLDRPAQKKLALVVTFQLILSFLDLLGVAAIGMLGALSITGIQSERPGDRVAQALNFLHLNNFELQTQVTILGILAVSLLLARTLISIFSTRKILFFLSDKSAKASSNLIRNLLNQPLYLVQQKTSQTTVYALTNGVNSLLLGVVGTFATMISDSGLLLILLIGLFVIDPAMTSGMILFFTIVGFLMYRLLREKVLRLGNRNVNLAISSNEKLLEVISTYREAMVRNTRKNYADSIAAIRNELGEVFAENSFVPYISKYVFELTIIMSALIISVSQFLINDAARAVGTLAVFLAAGTRIAPAALRIQQGFLTIKGNIGNAQPTLDLIRSLNYFSDAMIEVPRESINKFNPVVEVLNLSFSYPDSREEQLSNISFISRPGTVTALVGPTGSGKTTLIDLVLGIHSCRKQTVSVSGVEPRLAISKWPGKIGYVPQDTVIVQGSIVQNIALGFDNHEINLENVYRALNISQLKNFVSSLPDGLNTIVGERGARLSGGQRQRLGIARALYTDPELLILDEATSSLDAETELAISDAIHGLGEKVTVIVIAHRLSTVRSATQLIYLENGKILAKGNFDWVRERIPNFDKQAKLMGI